MKDDRFDVADAAALYDYAKEPIRDMTGDIIDLMDILPVAVQDVFVQRYTLLVVQMPGPVSGILWLPNKVFNTFSLKNLALILPSDELPKGLIGNLMIFSSDCIVMLNLKYAENQEDVRTLITISKGSPNENGTLSKCIIDEESEKSKGSPDEKDEKSKGSPDEKDEMSKGSPDEKDEKSKSSPDEKDEISKDSPDEKDEISKGSPDEKDEISKGSPHRMSRRWSIYGLVGGVAFSDERVVGHRGATFVMGVGFQSLYSVDKSHAFDVRLSLAQTGEVSYPKDSIDKDVAPPGDLVQHAVFARAEFGMRFFHNISKGLVGVRFGAGLQSRKALFSQFRFGCPSSPTEGERCMYTDTSNPPMYAELLGSLGAMLDWPIRGRWFGVSVNYKYTVSWGVLPFRSVESHLSMHW